VTRCRSASSTVCALPIRATASEQMPAIAAAVSAQRDRHNCTADSAVAAAVVKGTRRAVMITVRFSP
jgi:hypothetical protein